MRSRIAVAVLSLAVALLAFSSRPDPLDAQGVVAVAEEAAPAVLETVAVSHELAVRFATLETAACLDLEGDAARVDVAAITDCENADAVIVPVCPNEREALWGVAQRFAASGHRFWMTVCGNAGFGLLYFRTGMPEGAAPPRVVVVPPVDVGRGT